MIIAVVNSANLTDGLDGLLSGVSLIYSIAMGVLFLYFAKVFDSSFINEPRFVANRDGMLCMSVFAFAVAGGCLGFLKSNSYPAKSLWEIPAQWHWAAQCPQWSFTAVPRSSSC